VTQAIIQVTNGLRVLMVTKTNEGANNLTRTLDKRGTRLHFLRVVGQTLKYGGIPPEIVHRCAHTGIPEMSMNKQFEEERRRVSACPLIITTSCTAGGARFCKNDFDSIIVDEANQLVDPEFAILLGFDPAMITLYGDQAQIGPFVGSQRAKSLGYGESLIQRLPEILTLPQRKHGRGSYRHFLLNSQYRMHRHLAEFPSREFYEGKVQTSPDREDESFSLPFPNPAIPMVFVNVSYGHEQKAADGGSTLNIGEILAVSDILICLRGRNVRAKSVGLITFYAAAVDAANDLLPRLPRIDGDWLDGVEIGTVDAYEGREKDLIILMCVRSNSVQELGFLRDRGRMNVALTRARHGLFVVGNRDTLKSPSAGAWEKFVAHCEAKRVVVNQWPPP
jgi:regulator of nonsense transcripts 1